MNRNARLLTKRELQIVELMFGGLKDLSIAEELGISYRTVTTHWFNIYNKLGVHSRVELIKQLYKVQR